MSVDISVYVVTHKNYNVRSDCFYKPFCVGDYKKEGYLTEETGKSINQELCEKAYILFRSKIIEKQPNYVQAFDSVMEGNSIFLCNMFVIKREILERYCEWLFSFLLEVAEEMDVEGYDSYSQRVTGFFAEQMWTVWLRKNRLRIKELPYVIVK